MVILFSRRHSQQSGVLSARGGASEDRAEVCRMDVEWRWGCLMLRGLVDVTTARGESRQGGLLYNSADDMRRDR